MFNLFPRHVGSFLVGMQFLFLLFIGQAGAKEAILYKFTGGNDGGYPLSSLVADRAGNLYGTTSGGGVYGYGVIFKITLVGQETVLHAFDYGNDGGSPFAGLVFDKAGNLYGTTTIGGRGFGTVFKMLPDGTFSIIHYSTAALMVPIHAPA